MAIIHRNAYEAVVALDYKGKNGASYAVGTKNGRMNIPTFYEDVEGTVFLDGHDFKEIFDESRGNSRKYRHSLPIVKITRAETGQSIHRIFHTCHTLGSYKKTNYVALTYSSLLQLSTSNEDYKYIDQLEISEGSWFPFYWNHPHHATRISMRLGFVSLIISALSFIIAL